MKHTVNNIAAFGFIILGMFVIGAVDNVMPFLTERSSLWTFHFLRSVMVLTLMLILAWTVGLQYWPKSWKWTMARNLFSGLSMFLYFGSLAFVPIGVAVAALFTAPIWILVGSALFRSETVGWIRWLAAGIGFLGAILIIEPSPETMDWAIVMPLAAGLSYAIGNMATRSWCEGESTGALLFTYYISLAVGGGFGLLILALFEQPLALGADGFLSRGWVMPDGTMWGLFGLQAVLSLLGVGCLTRGYQLGEASYVAIYEYALLVFAASIAWIVWDQELTRSAVAGMALIVLSGVVIVIRSR